MHKTLKIRILIVDDDKSIASIVQYNLNKEGHTTNILHNGAEVQNYAKKEKPDLILLDWMLPSKSGIDICQELRADPITEFIPIIMISTKNDNLDKITGLKYGADDYITKPFSPSELIARINALLRRMHPALSHRELVFKDIKLNIDTYRITKNNIELKLAPIEFQILQLMLETPNNVITRENIILKVWDNTHVDQRTVDVHITRLRKILMSVDPEGEKYIKSVHGIGYKLQ